LHRKLLIALALLAIAPFGLAACGGDDDDETTDAATTQETTTEDSGGTAGGGGSTVSITADPSGALAFEEDSAEASAGSVTLELTNDSSTPHDVKVEGPDGDLGGTEVVSGGTASAAVDLEAGEYTFYCSVPGHREAGMEGTLTVE
jgi:plastocyanin